MARRLNPIGLGISDAELTAALLGRQKTSDSFSLHGWSRQVLPAGIINQGKVAKPALLKEYLESLFREPSNGFVDGREVVLSLPESICHHHVASIRNHQECYQMEQLAKRVIESRFPSTPDDLAWTWETSLDDLREHHLYMSATSKALFKPYLSILEDLGMKVVSVEGQAHSRNRFYFNKQHAPEPLMHIHIGGHQATLSLVDALGIYQTSSLGIGYYNFVQALARSLSLTESRAEDVLKTIGLRTIKHKTAFTIQDTIYSELVDLEKEARQFVAYYKYHHNRHPLAQQLKVTGEGAMIPGMAEWLSGRLDLPLRAYSSWASFTPGLQAKDGATFSDAIGAAMKGSDQRFNFLDT